MTVEQIINFCRSRGCKTLKECVTFMLTNYKQFPLEDCRTIAVAYEDEYERKEKQKREALEEGACEVRPVVKDDSPAESTDVQQDKRTELANEAEASTD